MHTPKYKRALLKISGKALMGESGYGIDPLVLGKIAQQIGIATKKGTQIAIVVGGGNIWRGAEAEAEGMDRVTADYAGMLATIINALAIQDALERIEVACRTQTAIPIQSIAEPYIRRRAIRHLEKSRVVIFAAGTGNPYMTTDTAAALRAIEIEAEILLMAKHNVDGIYDSDPIKEHTAKKFSHISHRDALTKHLEIMDATAFSLCLDNELPIVVFDINELNGIERAAAGESIGTLVSSR
ncbi:MAG: UMP kinase [Dehalococcoidia bacterium]|nr:UMP kinase [Dehalococcoidia bacterium]